MDYKGQQLCEQLYQFITILFSVVGFVIGYVVQSFRVTFLWSCAGLVAALIVCLPDWPWYNRHPLKWREPAPPAPAADDAAAAQLNGEAAAGETEQEGAADAEGSAAAVQAVQRKKGKSGKKKKKAAAAAAGHSQ